MYIDNWETFYQQARELFIVEPVRTRYVLKYRHCDGKFSVKVTDDRVVCMVVFRVDAWGRVLRCKELCICVALVYTSPWPMSQCLQYKSDQQIDLKKLEALNNLMFLGMAHGPDAAAGRLLDERSVPRVCRCVCRCVLAVCNIVWSIW